MTRPLLRQLIEEQVARRPQQNFLTFGELGFTYAEMDFYTNKVANALRELGLKSLDRVALFLPNSQDFIFCWFATIKLNVTMIPINTQLKGEALRYILGHAEPHAVITSAALWSELQALPGALPEGCRVLIMGAEDSLFDPGDLSPKGRPELFSYERLVAQAGAERPPEVAGRDEDTAIIMYTSGTTGYPKGVMLSRRAQTNHPLYYHPELIQTEPHEVAYTYLPLFHVTSQGVTMGSFIGGARLALDSEFNVFGFWERIRRANAVVFPYLGAVISMLYARPAREDDADNPARRALGAAVSKEIWADFEQRFGVKLMETYGQTEFYAVWCMHPAGQTRIGAAGRPPERAQIKIVDEKGVELPSGKIGEIVMQPAAPGLMMSGYYKQPELNAKVLKDGWYYTGDAGEMDADGYLYFRGRLKDYIRRRGENISAMELESIVSTHPAILEVAAVGVPSKLTEEEVLLCVVLKPGAELSPEDLYKFCREQLPAFMVPRYLKFLPELPKTATQRTKKFLLAQAGVAGAWERKAPKRNPGEAPQRHGV
jgi:carnitine-CoA ligase